VGYIPPQPNADFEAGFENKNANRASVCRFAFITIERHRSSAEPRLPSAAAFAGKGEGENADSNHDDCSQKAQGDQSVAVKMSEIHANCPPVMTRSLSLGVTGLEAHAPIPSRLAPHRERNDRKVNMGI